MDPLADLTDVRTVLFVDFDRLEVEIDLLEELLRDGTYISRTR